MQQNANINLHTLNRIQVFYDIKRINSGALNLNKKNNKQSLKIDPGKQKKLGCVKCNMMCYGALKSNIDCGLWPWSILLFSAP